MDSEALPGGRRLPFSFFLKRLNAAAVWNFVAAMLLFLMILGTCMIPYSRIPESARKKAAEVMSMTLAQAIDQFDTDYHRLPVPAGKIPALLPADADTDTSDAAGIVRILLAKEGTAHPQNSRNIDYLDGFPQAKPPKSPDKNATEGLVCEEDNFAIFDAWGNVFHLRLDSDGDGFVANPESPEEGAVPRLRARVLVWSAGKDGCSDTWDDNPKSWTQLLRAASP